MEASTISVVLSLLPSSTMMISQEKICESRKVLMVLRVLCISADSLNVGTIIDRKGSDTIWFFLLAIKKFVSRRQMLNALL